MSKEHTPVFESDRQTPEPSPSSEAKDLSSLVRQFDHLGGLANNGHVQQITPENFPDIPRDEMEEIRYIGYSARIVRLINISRSSQNPAIAESFKKEIERLTQARDEELIKHHSGIGEATSPIGISVETEKSSTESKPEKPQPPHRTGQYL